MIKIALIGEIGSGKTFISRCFKYPSFNADAEVAKIYKTNIQCFKKLKKKFPKETDFLKKAKLKNHAIQNGLMMFAYQAAEAFKIWHDIKPEINDELLKYLDND